MYRVPRFIPTRRSVPLQTRRLSTERASVQSIPVLARSRALAAGPSEARSIIIVNILRQGTKTR